MAEHLESLMGISMEKIREMVDVDTIVGKPITAPDGTLIIPISKVTFGFVSGGSDVPSKAPKEVFAGGTGAAVTVKPQSFIVIKSDGDVKLLDCCPKDNNIVESVFEQAPDFIEKIKGIFSKSKKEDGGFQE